MPRPYAALKAFLADPRRPKGTFWYHELQGFLFTIAGAPELVRPSEWMPRLPLAEAYLKCHERHDTRPFPWTTIVGFPGPSSVSSIGPRLMR